MPFSIAGREIAVIAERMGWPSEWLEVRTIRNADGPGNVFSIELESENVTEVFTGFGEKGVPAEAVAGKAIGELKKYLIAEVAAGEHLADQLLVPMAVAAGGSFSTGPLTPHTRTNIEVIGQFLAVTIEVEETARRTFLVRVGKG